MIRRARRWNRDGVETRARNKSTERDGEREGTWTGIGSRAVVRGNPGRRGKGGALFVIVHGDGARR